MRLALRTQLVLTGAFLVLLSVISIGILVQGEVKATLRDQMEQRGITIAKHLAGISGDFVMANEQLQLANFTAGSLKNHDVIYAQIMNQKGIILAASPASNINGLYYPPAGLENLGDEESLSQRYYNGRQWVQDVAFNIIVSGSRAGSVHIGMDEGAMDLVKELISSGKSHVMLIGHQPDLSTLVRGLTRVSLEMEKAMVVGITVPKKGRPHLMCRTGRSDESNETRNVRAGNTRHPRVCL